MKKAIKRLFLVVFALVNAMIFTNVSAATSAPGTITVGPGGSLPGYVAGTYFSKKVTSDGKYVYCTNIHLKTPANIQMKLTEQKDAGFAYIMKNGYPNKSITGNKDYDYYITQTAVWWYLDETTGSNNLSNSFKTTGSDPHGLRTHIKNLVTNAKNAKNTGYKKPALTLTASNTNLTLSSNKAYYQVSGLKVTGTSLSGNITLSLVGAPSGAQIVVDGVVKKSVPSGQLFSVRIPAANVTANTTFSVKASATGSVQKAYMYVPVNGANTYQSVVASVLYPETTSLNKEVSLSVKPTGVKIIKKSSETNQPLAGATLQLLDSNQNVVDTWVTTTSAHEIKNIPEGTYTLKETAAPAGYKLNTTPQVVTVKAGVINTVYFYNTKKKPTTLIIIKRDKDTNETLAGAEFVLKDSTGKEISRWVSTKNGHRFQGLPEGNYTVEEISAPAGYNKTDEIFNVTLEAGKTVTITAYNKKKYEPVLKIKKVNGETGETLAGASLQLKNEQGEVLYSWISTDDYYVIEKLPSGKYYLSETKAPKGYVLSNDIIEITITEDGEDQIVTFNNTPEVPVPDTGLSVSALTIVAGIAALGFGGSVVVRNAKKEQ